MTIKLTLIAVVVAGLLALTESSSYGAHEWNKTGIGLRSSQTQPVGGSVESMHGGAYRGSGGPSTRFVKEHGGYDPGKRSKSDVRGGLETALDAAPIFTSAGHVAQTCSIISPQRTGGISEIAPCGMSGVRGDRAQFVRAITQPVENRYFLSRLAH